jgi:hypothetical protein
MKSRRVHRVPLCGRCRAILHEAKALNPNSTFVFEALKKGGPLSDMTFTKLLRDHGLGALRGLPQQCDKCRDLIPRKSRMVFHLTMTSP